MPNDTLAAVLLSIYRDGFNDGSLGESPSPGGTLVAPADAESQWADEPEDVREAMRYAARKLAMMLDLVALPPELLVTRDQQKASDDEVTTLRSDARYLRGLALDAPTDEDAAALRRIAAKLELLADVAVPGVEADEAGGVGRWRDISGAGRDAVQPDPAKRPTRR